MRTFVYVLYEVMSGIHFDDRELQRICAEERVWGCKEISKRTFISDGRTMIVRARDDLDGANVLSNWLNTW